MELKPTWLRSASLVLTAMLLIAASSASAMEGASVLGAGGVVYQIAQGPYGSLFPEGSETDAGFSVLRLTAHGQDFDQRFLVPGTEGIEAEGSPHLVFERTSNTVYMVWPSHVNLIHPTLKLIGFNPQAGWTQPIDIISGAFQEKTRPKLSITRETFVREADGVASTHSRTILHLIFSREEGDGTQDLFYTPIIFEDGTYVGQGQPLRLRDLLDDQIGEAPEGTYSAAAISAGRDDHTVLVSFTTAGGLIVTVEIRVLPAAISFIADGARAEIIGVGVQAGRPDLRHVADKVRDKIMTSGGAFHTELLTAIADRAWSVIVESDDDADLNRIADKARAEIIGVGAKLDQRGLRQLARPYSIEADSTAVQIDMTPDMVEEGDHLNHLLLARPTAARPGPELPIGLDTDRVHILTSAEGSDMIVAWVGEDDSTLSFVTSLDAGWSSVFSMELSDQLTLDRALDILQERVR